MLLLDDSPLEVELRNSCITRSQYINLHRSLSSNAFRAISCLLIHPRILYSCTRHAFLPFIIKSMRSPHSGQPASSAPLIELSPHCNSTDGSFMGLLGIHFNVTFEFSGNTLDPSSWHIL